MSPIDVNDVQKFTEWLNDLEVTENLMLYSHIISLESEKEFLEKLSKGHNYSIIDINTNVLIGNCGYVNIDNLNQTAEAGIFIGNKDYWDRGYGTEALMLLMDYGFKAINLHSIFLRVYSFNKRAIKAYEKIGFKRIGVQREAIYRNMKRHDLIYMDILASEFYNN